MENNMREDLVWALAFIEAGKKWQSYLGDDPFCKVCAQRADIAVKHAREGRALVDAEEAREARDA